MKYDTYNKNEGMELKKIQNKTHTVVGIRWILSGVYVYLTPYFPTSNTVRLHRNKDKKKGKCVQSSNTLSSEADNITNDNTAVPLAKFGELSGKILKDARQ